MKKVVCVLIILTIVFNMSSCSLERYFLYKKDYPLLFDTYVSFLCYAKSQSEFDKYCDIAEENMEKYNKLFDIYNDYEGINNIKTINDNSGIKAIKVDKEIIELLEYGKRFYSETEGGVNIAFGSVLKIWHRYREEGKEIPKTEELEEASKHTDINAIEINKEKSEVFVNDSETSIDVGCCAKGYAVEKTAEALKNAGAKDFLINAGGNICAVGKNGNKKGWKIGIEFPKKDSMEIVKTLDIEDKSAVTSGDYQRYYEVDGKRYHHIIDTNTLFPSNICRSATIIGENSAICDMLSTAVFVLPIEKSRILIKKYNVEAVWIMEDGEIITA